MCYLKLVLCAAVYSTLQFFFSIDSVSVEYPCIVWPSHDMHSRHIISVNNIFISSSSSCDIVGSGPNIASASSVFNSNSTTPHFKKNSIISSILRNPSVSWLWQTCCCLRFLCCLADNSSNNHCCLLRKSDLLTRMSLILCIYPNTVPNLVPMGARQCWTTEWPGLVRFLSSDIIKN